MDQDGNRYACGVVISNDHRVQLEDVVPCCVIPVAIAAVPRCWLTAVARTKKRIAAVLQKGTLNFKQRNKGTHKMDIFHAMVFVHLSSLPSRHTTVPLGQ